MSEDLEDIALTIPCGYCGAVPDEWCTTKSSRRATWLHAARTSPIYSAYGLGYQDYEKYLREKEQRA